MAIEAFQTHVEAAPIVRTKAHAEHVGRSKIIDVLNARAVSQDKPAGRELMEYILANPKSLEAQALRSEKNWQDLRFVFPGTFVSNGGGYVYYVKWDGFLLQSKFVEMNGGVNIGWRENFRTVHEA